MSEQIRLQNAGKSRRRGAVAVLVATMLVVMVGFMALTVDVGYMYVARAEMQRTADASALAGTSGLMERLAEQRAHEYGTLNRVVNQQVISSELDVEIGNWDGVAKSFIPVPDLGIGGVRQNAVRVRGTRTHIDLFFAGILGHDTTDVRQSAVAVAGAGVCAGIWGLDGVTVDGDVTTDSYDSTDGTYGPGNMRPNGDMCSCGDIVVNGGITIRGDAMYGEGYDFIPFGTSYEVLGMIAEHGCNAPEIDINYGWAAANNDNDIIPLTDRGRDPFGGDPENLFVTGNDHLTLPPGTFYFNSAMLDGQAYLEITGPTTLYIDGNATLTGGGVINLTEDPHDLIIYARGPTVRMSGGATFYGALIAPTATIRIEGTFDAYGTVLAQFLDLDGNTNFHVDEGLVFDLFGIKAAIPVLVK